MNLGAPKALDSPGVLPAVTCSGCLCANALAFFDRVFGSVEATEKCGEFFFIFFLYKKAGRLAKYKNKKSCLS